MHDIQNIITERVDDIPLLLEQMQRMGLPTLLDEHFPTHRWTSSVSAELHTPGRCTFALYAIRRAISGSARRVDVDVAVPGRRVDHRHGGVGLDDLLQAFAPARNHEIDQLILLDQLEQVAGRSPPGSSTTEPSGRPSASPADATSSARAALDRWAIKDPRRTTALPDLIASAAASTVTFGRASYTIAITPIGTRTFFSCNSVVELALLELLSLDRVR